MILGYAYERVEADRTELAQFDDRTAWWEHYLWDAGCPNGYRPLADIDVVLAVGTPLVGLLAMQSHRHEAAHVVANDEVGVLDPSDGFPEHKGWSMFPALKRSQGFTLDSEFLAVSLLLPR